MSEREIIEEFAAMLRDYTQAQREFIDKLLADHHRVQEALIDGLLDRLEQLLAARRGPQPPPAPRRMLDS
jgi:hypothetical protein